MTTPLHRQMNRRDSERAEERGKTYGVSSKPIDALVRDLKECREAISALKKQEEKARELLLPLLDVMGGTYTDEVSGLTASIEKTHRFEWDVPALHKLVKDGLLIQSEFDACLVTTADKKVVQTWVDSGVLTDRQLNGVGAKKSTKVIEVLRIEEKR